MLELRYEVNGEEEVTLHVPMHLLGAVSTWLKNPQPPPPTPDEIAAAIVDEWHSVPIERNALRRRIAEAITTEREGHDV